MNMHSSPSNVNPTAAFDTENFQNKSSDIRREFLSNAFAWPQEGEQTTYICVYYTKANPNSATPWSDSQAFTTFAAADKFIESLLKKPDTLSISCCVSSQRECGPEKAIKWAKGEFKINTAASTAAGAVAAKHIIVELPFKNYGNDPSAARAAAGKFVVDTGLPKPNSIIVRSDRLVAVWVLDTGLPVGEWSLLAHAYVAAGKWHELKASWGHTTDSTRHISLWGTETTPDGATHPIKLEGDPSLTYTPDRLWRALEPHRAAAEGAVAREGNLKQERERKEQGHRAGEQAFDDLLGTIVGGDGDEIDRDKLEAKAAEFKAERVTPEGKLDQDDSDEDGGGEDDSANLSPAALREQQLLKKALKEARKRYFYIKKLDRMWDRQDRMLVDASRIDVCEAHLRRGKISPYRMITDAKALLKYNDLTYRPGAPEIVLEEKAGKRFECVNTFVPGPNPAGGITDLFKVWDVFCRHGVWMLGRKQFRILFKYFAWLVANPGKKPGWVPVIIGPQGFGKDWLVYVFQQALGPHNVSYIDFADVTNKFNSDWAQTWFLVMNEARNNGLAEAKITYNKIKTFTASLPPTRPVEEKGIQRWRAPNIQAGIVLANYDDAIALDADDRRFVVLTCLPQELPSKEFFDPHFAWCPRHDDLSEAAYAQRRVAGAQLLGCLKQVDLSDFNSERPPMTAGKQTMIATAHPELEWLDSQFSDDGTDKGKYHGRKVMVVNDVLDAWHNYTQVSRHKGIALNDGAVKAKLRELGYTARKTQVRVSPDKKIRPWLSKEAVANGMLDHPAEIKDAYENSTSSAGIQSSGSSAQPGATVTNIHANRGRP